MISTPIMSPTALTIAFPVAPEPDPPQKTTLGTPQDCGPTPHPFRTLSKAVCTLNQKLKSFILSGKSSIPPKLSTIPLALLNTLAKSKLKLEG